MSSKHTDLFHLLSCSSHYIYSDHIVANVAVCWLGTAKYRSLTDKWTLLVPSLVEESYLLSAMDWQNSNSMRRVGGHVLGMTYVLTQEWWWWESLAKEEKLLILPGKAPQALGCVASRQGRMDSSGHWHWSRPHLPGPQTKAIRPHPPGCCPGSL